MHPWVRYNTLLHRLKLHPVKFRFWQNCQNLPGPNTRVLQLPMLSLVQIFFCSGLRVHILEVFKTCHWNTYYLLTAWCRVLLEKLAGLQLVKKLPAFYGTRRFITAFASFRHPSLSWASPIQSTCPQPTSWRSILYYPPICAYFSPAVSFPTVSPPGPYTPPLLPHTSHMPSPSHSVGYIEFYLLQNLQIHSRAHPASCSMESRVFFSVV